VDRLTQSLVLLLLGLTVLRTSLTDLHLRYVKQGLQPFLVTAAVLLVTAALMSLRYDLQAPDPSSAGRNEHGSDGDQHGGDHEPRIAWLLLLPVLALMLVVPPALGSYLAGRAGTVLNARQVAQYPPLPAGDPVGLTLWEYASRASSDGAATLVGRRVRLTGFVATGPDGRPMLARIALSCCAADGRPIKVGMTGDAPAGLIPDTWIQVIGRHTSRVGEDPINRQPIPYVAVESWRQVPAPREPYE
jgi:uncharacterized repeat protein (TIGR03943 family)